MAGRPRGGPARGGPGHHHQRSLQNTNPTVNPMQLNWSMSQAPNAFTSSFSPGPLSPPQPFHKRASSFDPNVIQRSSSYTSAESLNLPTSQLSLHRSQVGFNCQKTKSDFIKIIFFVDINAAIITQFIGLVGPTRSIGYFVSVGPRYTPIGSA